MGIEQGRTGLGIYPLKPCPYTIYCIPGLRMQIWTLLPYLLRMIQFTCPRKNYLSLNGSR
jgi:hypothetical protein